MPPRPTPRDLGIPVDGEPGPYNAIIDVPGVEVGHTTLLKGEGPLVIGQGPVRTGVTAILPLGRQNLGPVPAAWFPFNGNGEMTGTTWIEESGLLTGPILLTNTLSIGTVRDAVINWGRKKQEAAGTFDPNDYSSALALPVVAETWDGGLNDIYGFHVRDEDVFHALDMATSGPVPQGNVGGGTGMVCYDFKGGIGTASRIVENCWGLSPFVAGTSASRVAEQKGTVPFSSSGSPPSALARSPDQAIDPTEGLHQGGTGQQSASEVGQCRQASAASFTIGVLVQANHGKRSDLLIRGVPVGHEVPLSEIPSYRRGPSPFSHRPVRKRGLSPSPKPRPAARSSSSSPPTPRCSLTNSSAWPAAPPSASPAPAPSATTTPATSSSPSRPRTTLCRAALRPLASGP